MSKWNIKLEGKHLQDLDSFEEMMEAIATHYAKERAIIYKKEHIKQELIEEFNRKLTQSDFDFINIDKRTILYRELKKLGYCDKDMNYILDIAKTQYTTKYAVTSKKGLTHHFTPILHLLRDVKNKYFFVVTYDTSNY